MKKILIILAAHMLVVAPTQSAEKIQFDRYFIDKTMRIDYHHTGNATTEFVSIDQIYQQGIWAGNPERLIDRFDNGRYQLNKRERQRKGRQRKGRRLNLYKGRERDGG